MCHGGDGNEAARVFLAHRGDEEDVAVSLIDKAYLLVVLRVFVDPTSLQYILLLKHAGHFFSNRDYEHTANERACSRRRSMAMRCAKNWQ